MSTPGFEEGGGGKVADEVYEMSQEEPSEALPCEGGCMEEVVFGNRAGHVNGNAIDGRGRIEPFSMGMGRESLQYAYFLVGWNL